jgi:hypothetical protein
MIIPRLCDNCQEPYGADTRYLNRGQGRYCSRKCSGSAHRAAAAENSPQPNTSCGYCSKEFYRQESKKRSKSGLYFCSREHQSAAFSDGSIDVKPGPPVGPSGQSECVRPGCNIRTKNEYCKNCSPARQIELWLSGDLQATWSGSTKEPKKFVKQYLLDTRGDRCEKCGWDEKAPDGRSIIQMDHIDGNYLNNALENLQLLCPNHHAMTDNYGSLNKSGGRAHRRKNMFVLGENVVGDRLTDPTVLPPSMCDR